VVLAAVAGAIVVVGPVVSNAHAWADATVSPPTTYDGTTMATDCSSDVTKPLQAWLAQLPANSTVDLGGACYQVDSGITLDFPKGLTIEDGSFKDDNNSGQSTGHGSARGVPVFAVVGGTNVTFENLTFTGVDRAGYWAKEAFQAAIELQGTIGASLSWLTISKLYGDGINLEPLRGGSDHESGGIVNPAENIDISNVTIRGTGRQGITLASVKGATITDVTIANVGMDAFDFESDQSGEGAENVVINGCSFSRALNIFMDGPDTGPITVENCVMSEADTGDAVSVKNLGGHADAGPLLFDDDAFKCGASAYVACFDLNGATDMTVENSTIRVGYPHDTIRELAYTATDHSGVTFTDDTVSGYGRAGHSAKSSVSVSGGTWSPVVPGPTTTSLAQSADSVAFGSEGDDTFVVTVDGQKAVAPTGTVTVSDTATDTPICDATLVAESKSSSSGACEMTADEFGPNTSFSTVSAGYYGDGNFEDSQSASPQTLTIGPGSTTTTLVQTSSTVPYGSESNDTFIATVTGQPGDTPPSGTVSVEDSATASTICTATLVSDAYDSSTGICSPTDEEFAASTTFSTVTASYGGDATNAASDSTPDQSFVIGPGSGDGPDRSQASRGATDGGPASTTTSLSQTAPTVGYGSESADNIVVAVTGQAGGSAPTSAVTVEDSATGSTICTATLSLDVGDSALGFCGPTDEEFASGTAFTTVTATYSGDDDYAGSASSTAQTFSVVPDTATTTTLSPTSTTVGYGSESADTFVATVTGQGEGAPPTGTISVEDTATMTPICTATVFADQADSSTGICNATDEQFAEGTDFTTLVATYSGDGTYLSSASSPPQSLTVVPGSSTALAQSTATVDYGSQSADTFVATVTGYGGEAAPTGSVSVDDSATMTPICSAPLVANPDNTASATCNPTDEQFPSGTSFTTVTATYSGDGTYDGSVSSPAQSFTVTDSGGGGGSDQTRHPRRPPRRPAADGDRQARSGARRTGT